MVLLCSEAPARSRRSPFVVELSEANRTVLEERSRAYTAPFAEVVRAKIVLLAADGEDNTVIAARLNVHVSVVSRWRKRFCQVGLDGLVDRPRSGRRRSFPAPVVAEVKAMACEPPEAREVPLSRWSSAELAAQAIAEGLVESVSASTVRRWLHADAIRPWQHVVNPLSGYLVLAQALWDDPDHAGGWYCGPADEEGYVDAGFAQVNDIFGFRIVVHALPECYLSLGTRFGNVVAGEQELAQWRGGDGQMRRARIPLVWFTQERRHELA